MPINLELLRSFLDAALASNFRRAATTRRVSVSAISQQMKTLEGQLGVPLFERVGRGIRPTPAATRLAQHLKVSFASIEDGLAAVLDEQGAIRGPLRIGMPRVFGRAWIAPRLPALLRAHPELTARLSFGLPSQLEADLSAGELDLCLLVRSTEHPGLATAPLAKERFVAVAAPSYLARAGLPRTLADFQKLAYLVFNRNLAMHAPWWRATFGRRTPLPTNIVCEAGCVDALFELARAGLGAAVLPDYLVEDALRQRKLTLLAPSLATEPGAEDGTGRRRSAENTIFLAWRKGAPATRRFELAKAALLAS